LAQAPPVQEVIEHQRNGLLVDFFDAAQLAHTVCEALAHPLRYAALREQARQTIIERFDLTTHCLPQWINLLENC
jgi:glycosyltransferase involved in cell wall biosynthesis